MADVNFAAMRKRVHTLADLVKKDAYTDADDAEALSQAVSVVGLTLVGLHEEVYLIREALQQGSHR
jgi:hypothetical protein